jgi:hypothetical protein
VQFDSVARAESHDLGLGIVGARPWSKCGCCTGLSSLRNMQPSPTLSLSLSRRNKTIRATEGDTARVIMKFKNTVDTAVAFGDLEPGTAKRVVEMASTDLAVPVEPAI